MQQTVAAVFDDPANAQQAINELGASGFQADQISTLVSEAKKTQLMVRPDVHGVDGIALGGLAGTVLGGLTAAGAFLIPGVGAVLAAGPVLTVLAGMGAGATTGGLAGGLIGIGLPDDEARLVAEDLEQGRVWVSVATTDEKMTAHALQILGQFGPARVATFAANSRS